MIDEKNKLISNLEKKKVTKESSEDINMLTLQTETMKSEHVELKGKINQFRKDEEKYKQQISQMQRKLIQACPIPAKTIYIAKTA